LLWDHTGLGHVNSVKELTDILVLGLARLLNVGSSLGDAVDVVSGENNLVLDLLCSGNGHTLEHWDPANNKLAEIVSDLHVLSLLVIKSDLDGEMGIDESHLVLKAPGNTSDEVLDVADHSADTGDLLAGTKPDTHSDRLGGSLNLKVQVAEVALEGPAGSSHSHNTRLDLDRNSLGNWDRRLGLDRTGHVVDLGLNASKPIYDKPFHKLRHVTDITCLVLKLLPW